MCAWVRDIALRLAPGSRFYLYLRAVDRLAPFPLALKFSFAGRPLPSVHELASINGKHWSVAT